MVSGVVVGSIGLLPVTALAAPTSSTTSTSVSCGSTITGPAALTHDMHCHGDAVTLARGTLDLRQHTITGDGTGTGITIGTDTDDTPITATVENGTLTHFGTGIGSSFTTGQQLRVKDLSITHSTDGVNTDGMSVDLDHVSLAYESGTAIINDGGRDVTVTHSTISHAGFAVTVQFDGAISMSDTIVTKSVSAISCSEGVVTLNRVLVNNNTQGLDLAECEGSTITDSAFIDNSNAATYEDEGFDDVANPTLTVKRVLFQGNKVGLHLSIYAMTVSVSDSVFRQNGTGIAMDRCTTADQPCLPVNDSFSHNLFIQNRGNGLTWGDGTVTMTKNQFVSNGGWGFYASSGTTVVDGGGNAAHDNHSGNCHGLQCS
jgi:hypothetical protein